MVVFGSIIGGVGSLFDIQGLSILGACFSVIGFLCLLGLIIFGVLSGSNIQNCNWSNFTIDWSDLGGIILCLIIIGFFVLLKKYF